MFWRQKTPKGCGRRFRKKFKLVSHSLGGNMVLASQNTSRCLENKFNAFSSWICFFFKNCSSVVHCRRVAIFSEIEFKCEKDSEKMMMTCKIFICGVQNPSTEFGWQKAEKTGENCCRKKRKRAAKAKGGATVKWATVGARKKYPKVNHWPDCGRKRRKLKNHTQRLSVIQMMKNVDWWTEILNCQNWRFESSRWMMRAAGYPHSGWHEYGKEVIKWYL